MSYPGGKNGSGVAQTIINLMPPHDVYIEAFLGSGAVLRAKCPARSYTVGIDVSRAALDLTMAAIADGVWDLVSPDLTFPAGAVRNGDGIPQSTIDVFSDFAGVLARSDDVRRRTSPRLAMLQVDSVKWLLMNDHLLTPQTLVYCDPPYIRSSRRSSRDLYAYEMTDAQHLKLLNVLKSLSCMVLLSGYYSVLYAVELRTWNCISFHTTNRAGDRTTEYVWFNYPKPVELHDYQYLGKNFRERERIKRKMKRWKDRLGRMPELEKQALLWAMHSTQ
jgi:DNA adenine methylase